MSEDDKKRLFLVANCGVEFAASVFVGTIIGIWIDKHFDKFPIFMIIFFLCGCVSGYWNVLHYIEITKKKDKEKQTVESDTNANL